MKEMTPEPTETPSRASSIYNQWWVWHSTPEARAAGKISLVACVETIVAVSLYWWIALNYNSRWQVVSVVLVAPMLLLRSPKSIATGVKWFLRDWFEIERYSRWSAGKTAVWNIVVSLPFGYFSKWLCTPIANSFQANTLLELSVYLAVLSVAFSYSLAGPDAFAATSSDRSTDDYYTATTSTATVLACAASIGVVAALFPSGLDGVYSGLFVVVVIFALGGAFASILSSFAFGLGTAIRAFVFRTIATFRHAFSGISQIPSNWRENNLIIDSFTTPELLPGIRESRPHFALDGLARHLLLKNSLYDVTLFQIIGALLFFPSAIYRFNIKATAWFWWPLAYLLTPVPKGGADSREKQALCWPWTNPFQMLLIGVGAVLAIASVTLHYINLKEWSKLGHIPALPLPLKVSLALDWSHIAPWHWAQWITGGAGLAMLWVAGNARSHDINGNWSEIQAHWLRWIRLMTGLQRVRTLAVVALLLMGLGALLLQEPSLLSRINVPAEWIVALKHFYRLDR